MFDDFEVNCALILKDALNESMSLHCQYVSTDHVLLAMLKDSNEIQKKFNDFGISYDNFKNLVIRFYEKENRFDYISSYSLLLKNIIWENINNNSDRKLNEYDLLNSILDCNDCIAIRLLLNLNIDIIKLRDSISLKSNNLFLKRYGTILNDEVDMNESIIGREEELLNIIRTLLRKNKNNPLLIGEAGVGKTAVVEELARNINNGNVCDELKNKRIVKLDMSSLLAGSRYRGDFEEKLIGVIDEVKSCDDYILFIDEIHTILNAGGAEGAISAGDILKPYLARGKVKCIGATTIDEYNKLLSTDSALDRRFEKIYINEISNHSLKKLLMSVKREYEKFHGLNISETNIDDIIKYSNNINDDKHNPDKVLELLDSVCSYVNYRKFNKCNLLKQRAIQNNNWKDALSYKMQELEEDNKISNNDIKAVTEFKNNNISIDKINKCINNLKCKIECNKFINGLVDVFKNHKSNYLIYGVDNPKQFNDILINNLNNYFNVLRIDFNFYLDNYDFNKIIGGDGVNNYLLKKVDNNICKIIVIENFDVGSDKLKHFFYNMIMKKEYINNLGINKKCDDVIFLISGLAKTFDLGFNPVVSNNYFNNNDVIYINEKEIVSV